MNKKLERNIAGRKIAGVASGLAEHLDLEVSLIRLLFVLAFIFGLSGLLIYIILWIAIPKQRYSAVYDSATVDYRVDNPTELPHANGTPVPSSKKQGEGRVLSGIVLIIAGGYFLLWELKMLPAWFSFHKLWPVILIFTGIFMVLRSRRSAEAIVKSTSENIVSR